MGYGVVSQRSGRALARAAKVESFRSPLFRLWSGFLVRPSPTFPAAPPKMPYGGFSPVRLQAQAPRSSVWNLPPSRSALKPDPRHPCGPLCVCSSLRDVRAPARLPASVCGPLALPVPPEPRGPRSGRVLLSLPSSLGDLIRQSGDLRLISSLASYRGSLWHSRILLPGLHTFRTFTAVLSRIAVCNFRRESGTCTPILRTSAGHRGEGRNPWHLQCSRNQLRAGTQFRRLVRSLSLRPSWLLASWADQTEQRLSLPQAFTSGLPALKSPEDCRI